MKLATPRTRAALADRIEIERAERERVERRNGNLNSDFNGHTQHNRHQNLAAKSAYSASSESGPGPAPGKIGVGPAPGLGMGMGGYDDNSVLARARERERTREKRYSMPVTSTGIGYPSNSTFGTRSATRSDESGADSKSDSYANTHTNTKATAPVNAMGGNGRSSLMIPVGNIAKAKRDDGVLGIGVGVENHASRAGSFRRDGGSGVYSGYEYIE